jgi:hypothetical protein
MDAMTALTSFSFQSTNALLVIKVVKAAQLNPLIVSLVKLVIFYLLIQIRFNAWSIAL